MANFVGLVSVDLDDGYWAGSWSTNNSSVGIGRNSLGGDVYAAFRFTNVNIPNGVTVTSATLKITASENSSKVIANRIYGIDEDDTANFSSDPTGRSKTTAYTNFNKSGATLDAVTSIDVTSIVQEILNRAGWASGNHMGFISVDQSSSNDNILRFYDYTGSTSKCAELDVTYAGSSPSASQSPSSSLSLSPSASLSFSPSSSKSASPSPFYPFYGLKIAKEGIDVLNTDKPYDFIFNSDYGTLKYFDKIEEIVQIDNSGDDGTFSGHATINHNLGYYPFVEAYVRVYIGSPSGNYEYAPFAGAGASVFYSANFVIKENTIELYAEFIGVSTSIWNFEFVVFIYKNNLNLS